MDLTMMKHTGWQTLLLAMSFLPATALAQGRAAETAADRGTRFVVAGHSYGVLHSAERRKAFIDAVNAEDCDLIFMIGDIDGSNAAVIRQYDAGFEAPVYYAPGDHDVDSPERRAAYEENVGYLSKMVEVDDARFLLFDSAADVTEINAFLAGAVPAQADDKVTVSLAHHRIWDNSLLALWPDLHDKSYAAGELPKSFWEQVDVIFSGVTGRQYLGTTEHNRRMVYLADIVEGVFAYTVGMTTHISFLVVEITDGDVQIQPRVSPLELTTVEPRAPIDRGSIMYLILTTVKSGRFLLGGLLGVMGMGLIAFVICRMRTGRRQRA